MRRCSRKTHGFSLVELLVSAVIIGIGLVALSQLYIGALWTYQTSRYTSLATQRAQYELDNIQRIGLESYTTMTDPTTVSGCFPSSAYTVTSSNASPITLAFSVDTLPSGSGTIVITEDPLNKGTTAGNALASVAVTINWTAIHRKQSSLALTTFVTNYK